MSTDLQNFYQDFFQDVQASADVDATGPKMPSSSSSASTSSQRANLMLLIGYRTLLRVAAFEWTAMAGIRSKLMGS
ncbi:MAG: hypothetical protein R2712_07730 [Vicinamibacterales bacterium]